MEKMKNLTILGVVVVILIALVGLSVSVVPVGHTGIMLTMGCVQDTPLDEGVNFKIPFVQRIVTMDNRIQKMEISTEAFSRDIQTVSATMAVNYKISRSQTFSLYGNVGINFENILIVPATHESLKSVSAQYTAEELISSRQKVSEEIMSVLNGKTSVNGIDITAFNIIDFDFSSEYIKAVEDKQVAEQKKKQADIENSTAIEKAKAEAERVQIEAQGRADALRVEAAGKAESYRLQNEALSELNVQMEYISKWNGRLPQIQSGGSSLIYDISKVVEPSDDSQNDYKYWGMSSQGLHVSKPILVESENNSPISINGNVREGWEIFFVLKSYDDVKPAYFIGSWQEEPRIVEIVFFDTE